MSLAVIGAGMVTSLGYGAPASCAALRCRRRRFEDTRFKFEGEWVVGAPVQLPGSPRGAARLLTMTAMTLDEAIAQLPPGAPGDTAWVVCLPEPERAGRPADLERIVNDRLRARLADARRLAPQPQLLTGRLSPVEGLRWLEQRIAAGHASHGILSATDGYLHAASLATLHARGRLSCASNSSGLVPGEGSGAIVVSAPRDEAGELQYLGSGWGHEPGDDRDAQPVVGVGLAAAYRGALSEAGLAEDGACGFAHLDYRIADLSGESRGFKEAALALARTMRVRKPSFDLWHIADCVGHVGAAAIPLIIGVALDASRNGYAPGPGVLMHFSADTGQRAALVLRELGRPSPQPLD